MEESQSLVETKEVDLTNKCNELVEAHKKFSDVSLKVSGVFVSEQIPTLA